MIKNRFLLFTFIAIGLFACTKNNNTANTGQGTSVPSLVFRFKFDSTQVRLNNLGVAAAIPAGNCAQSPKFNTISAHYIELAPTAFTALGAGKILYHAPETTAGGAQAINFAQSKIVAEGQDFLRIPLDSIASGSYQYLRVSLGFQNYDIKYRAVNPIGGAYLYLSGTVASFVGYKTYLTNYQIKNSTISGINANKLQGYWGFETNVFGTNYTSTGQAPPGATTVPNPIWNTSPIPQGSCVVTGPFAGSALTITGNETSDIIVTISLSTNKSFEWKDALGDNIFEPAAGDTVKDMGLRGMIPIVQY